MNFDTWLALYREPYESREEAAERYADQQGYDDPAEKQGFLDELPEYGYITPEEAGQRFNVDTWGDWTPPVTETPDVDYIDDPDAWDQFGAGIDEAQASGASALAGPVSGFLTDYVSEDLGAGLKGWAEEERDEQLAEAAQVKRPQSREEILKEDPDSWYKYTPEFFPTGHEIVRSTPTSLAAATIAVPAALLSAKAAGVVGLAALGKAAVGAATGMAAGNVASSLQVAGESYERAKNDPAVREELGVDPNKDFKDLLPEDQQKIDRFATDVSQSAFGHRLYTSGLVEMASFIPYGPLLARWGAEVGLGTASEMWDRTLYTEDAAQTLVEYGMPRYKVQELQEKMLALGPSAKETFVKSLVQEGIMGGGFSAFESISGISDPRVNTPATASAAQAKLVEGAQKEVRDDMKEGAKLDAQAQSLGFENADVMNQTREADKERQRVEEVRQKDEALREKQRKGDFQASYDKLEAEYKATVQERKLREELEKLQQRKIDARAEQIVVEEDIYSAPQITAMNAAIKPILEKQGFERTADEKVEVDAYKKIYGVTDEKKLLDIKGKKILDQEGSQKRSKKERAQAQKKAQDESDRGVLFAHNLDPEGTNPGWIKKTLQVFGIGAKVKEDTGPVTVKKKYLASMFRGIGKKFKKLKDKIVVVDGNDFETVLAALAGRQVFDKESGEMRLADADENIEFAKQALKDSRAWTIGDQIFINADGISGKSVDEVVEQAIQLGMFHEPIAHIGLKEHLESKGEGKFNEFLDDFFATNKRDIEQWVTKYASAYLDEGQNIKDIPQNKQRELAEEYLANLFVEFGVRDPNILAKIADSITRGGYSLIGKRRVTTVQAREMLAEIQREYIGGERNIITGDFFDRSHWLKPAKRAGGKEADEPQWVPPKIIGTALETGAPISQLTLPEKTEGPLTPTVAEAVARERSEGTLLGKLKKKISSKKKKPEEAQGEATGEARFAKRVSTPQKRKLWQKTHKPNPVQETKRRDEGLKELAKRLEKGEVTFEEYRDQYEKIHPIRTFNTVPKLSSRTEIASAINEGQYEKGKLIGEDSNLKAGMKANVRFDVDSMNKYNVGVITAVSPEAKGSHYGRAAHLVPLKDGSPVKMITNQKKGVLGIATGEGKFPMAFLKGTWKGTPATQIKLQAQKALKDPNWIQVGMNPTRQTSFYARETKTVNGKEIKAGTPLGTAEEVLQVGMFVIAKNPTTTVVPTFTSREGKEVRFSKEYHGSPTTFDKFKTSKIGRVNVYGWGLYFTSDKGLAEVYASQVPEGWAKKDAKKRVYEVSLAPKEVDYMDWDLPLRKQSKVVKKGVNEILKTLSPESPLKRWFRLNMGEMTGKDFYQWVTYTFIAKNKKDFMKGAAHGGVNEKKASLYLLSKGIRGNKITTTQSKDSPAVVNKVIFSEGDIKIDARHSKRLATGKKLDAEWKLKIKNAVIPDTEEVRFSKKIKKQKAPKKNVKKMYGGRKLKYEFGGGVSVTPMDFLSVDPMSGTVRFSKKPDRYKATGGDASWIESADNGDWMAFDQAKTLDDVKDMADWDFYSFFLRLLHGEKYIGTGRFEEKALKTQQEYIESMEPPHNPTLNVKTGKSGWKEPNIKILENVDGYVDSILDDPTRQGHPILRELRGMDRDKVKKDFLNRLTAEHDERYIENFTYLQDYDDPFFQSMMMRAIHTQSTKTQINIPPILTGAALAETRNRFKDGKITGINHLWKVYREQAAIIAEERLKNADKITSLDGGEWVKLPQVPREATEKQTNEILETWSTYSDNNWCTSRGQEKYYAPAGPMWVYRKNDQSLIAIRFVGDNIEEIQSQVNNGTIPPQYVGVVKEFADSSLAKLSEKSQKTIDDAQKTAKILSLITSKKAKGASWTNVKYLKKELDLTDRYEDMMDYEEQGSGEFLLLNDKTYAFQRVDGLWLPADLPAMAKEISGKPWDKITEDDLRDAAKKITFILGESSFQGGDVGRMKIMDVGGRSLTVDFDRFELGIKEHGGDLTIGKGFKLKELHTVYGKLMAGSPHGQDAPLSALDLKKQFDNWREGALLHKLHTVQGKLDIEQLAYMPNLTTVAEDVTLNGNSYLPAFETIGANLIIGNVGSLPALKSIEGDFLFQYEYTPDDFDYPADHYELIHDDIENGYSGTELKPLWEFDNLQRVEGNFVLDGITHTKPDPSAHAHFISIPSLVEIGGNLRPSRHQNPVFETLHSVKGNVLPKNWGQSIISMENTRYDKAVMDAEQRALEGEMGFGINAPALTVVGGDFAYYPNTFVPNLKHIGGDLHIFVNDINDLASGKLEERGGLKVTSFLHSNDQPVFPNLTHVGGEIMIHLTGDNGLDVERDGSKGFLFKSTRFMHLKGNISTHPWASREGVSNSTPVANPETQTVTKEGETIYSTEKRDADKDGNIAIEQSYQDIETAIEGIKIKQKTNISESYPNIAPKLEYIGGHWVPDDKRIGPYIVKTDPFADDPTSPDALYTPAQMKSDRARWRKMYGHKLNKPGIYDADPNIVRLYSEALRDTTLDPRGKQTARHAKLRSQPSPTQLESEWRKKSGKVAPDTEEPTEGININDSKQNFTAEILSGRKTIETRDSNSLKRFIGQEVGIIRTGKGKAEVVGYATVGEPVVYNNRAEFKKDQSKHLVKTGSDYDIRAGKVKYGYPLTNVRKVTPFPVTSKGIVSRKIDTPKKGTSLPSDKVSLGNKKFVSGIYTRESITPKQFVNPKGEVRTSKILMRSAAAHAMGSSSWNPLTRWTEKTQPFADKLLKHMVAQGTLPDKLKYHAIRREVKGVIKGAEDAGKALYDVLKDTKQADVIFKYFTTKGANPRLITDRTERAAAVSAKEKIDAIGVRLVKKGLMREKTRQEHESAYLPQVYLKYLMGQDNFRRAVTRGGVNIDQSYLKARKDIPEGIKKLILGQIEDPAYLASKATSVPVKDLAILDWLGHIAANPNWVVPKSMVSFDTLGAMKKTIKDKKLSKDLLDTLDIKDTKAVKVSSYWLENEAARIDTMINSMAELTADERTIVIDLTNEMKAAAKEITGQNYDTTQYRTVPESPKYGMLAGIAVRKEIYDDIFGGMVMTTGDLSTAEMILGNGSPVGDYNRLWKWSKVPANPPSWVRNFGSNLILMNMGGVSVGAMPGLMISSLADMRKSGKHKGKLHQLAKDLGLTAGTFSNVELGRIEREFKHLQNKIKGQKSAPWAALGAMKGAFAKFQDATTDIYGGIDSLGKMMMLKHQLDKQGIEIKDLAKYKGEERLALDDIASNAEKWLFDYSNVKSSVRFLRQAPFGAPFISFTSFVAPLMLETAITKPWKFAPYYALGWAMKEWFKNNHDLDEEDLEGLKVGLSEYLREKATESFFPTGVIPLPFLDANKRVQFLDVSYLYPWGMFSEIAGELTEGNIGGALKTVGLMGSPLFNIASAVSTGIDPFSRREIINPNGTPTEQAMDIWWYAFNLTMPPMLHGAGPGNEGFGALTRLHEAWTGKLTKEGEARFTMGQAFGRMAGFNVTPLAVPEGRIKHLRWDYSQIQKFFRQAKRHIKNMYMMQEPKSEIAQVQKEYMEKLNKKVEEFQNKVRISNPPESLIKERRSFKREKEHAALRYALG